MFMLNGHPLAIDTPFTTQDGTQYPANWLRHASAQEKAAIGITEVADPVPYDDRFYWGPGNPKDFAQVKAMMNQRIRDAATSLLAPTDYKMIRKVETGDAVDPVTLTNRAAIRSAFAVNAAAIEACTTVDQLAALQLTWPGA